MTHHHHDHDHDHHHHDHHETPSAMSFDEKLAKLLEHWIKHNDDHAENYKDWAKKAKDNDMTDVAAVLEEAARITLSVTKQFEKAANLMRDA
ncbi:hypothetical protein QUF80_16310 [Desulfococcaceae bacterium HSG8]|nr:hypothetical protein [Desulfococcaceae bacterium HSG8]